MSSKDGEILPSFGPSKQRENRVTHALLGLPELLMNIFGPLEKGELARLARVCRVWSSIALDLLWREIPDLGFLLGTGYSLRYDNLAKDFVDTPTDGGWDVIKGYAQRVRNVDCFVGEFTPAVISHLSARLQSACDNPYFLPNLRGIRLIVRGHSKAFLSLIRMIPPGLKTFHLDYPMGLSTSRTVVTQILKIIHDAPSHCLTSITIPSFHTATRDVEAVISVVRPQSNLEKLDLTGFLFTAESLATVGYHPRLTELGIRHHGESLQTVVELFVTIGSSFRILRHLTVRLDEHLRDEVPFSVLAGISSCCELRLLEVWCDNLEKLTSQMVSDMGRWWPSMEVFGIRDGYFTSGTDAPLSILPDILQVWSTTLKSLSIKLDPGDQLPQVPESTHLKFQNLEDITVETSTPIPYDRLVNIAEYLAAVTTPGFIVREWGLVHQRQWRKVNRIIQGIHEPELLGDG